MLVHGIFAPLHDGQDLLFLQPSPNHLNAYGQASHPSRVVVFVRALRDAVELLEVEGGGEGIFDRVDVGDWNDTGGVIELPLLVDLADEDRRMCERRTKLNKNV